ncbi:MAG TPA: lipid-A-disaccharide synthase [Xanthobacteraceae bacterium]|jgi:lipid-A-disaccharide synthase
MRQHANTDPPSERLELFLVAAEESGDQLGAALMRALRKCAKQPVDFSGVGGREMSREGIASLYPIDDLPLIGFTAIPRRLPRILRLMRFTARAIVARPPQGLIIIDSPGFTRGIARRVRLADPNIPIVEYVSPSVWAWRPGRARVLRGYIDHILALLPFEPEVHRRLGGPACSYVGHPLTEAVAHLRPNSAEASRRAASPPVLLMLPGSRMGEIRRLFHVFALAVLNVRDRIGEIEIVIPTLPHLADEIRSASQRCNIAPRIIVDPAEKQAAFRIARAALAKSGTVTLELALAGVPMVTAYKVSQLEYLVGKVLLRRLSSIILTNILLSENVVPELIQHQCTPDKLADMLVPLFRDTSQRRGQIEAFSRLDKILEIPCGASPAMRAAKVVLDVLAQRAQKVRQHRAQENR